MSESDLNLEHTLFCSGAPFPVIGLIRNLLVIRIVHKTHWRCTRRRSSFSKHGFQPRSQGSLLPVPTERARETLVGSGHVVPEQT